MPIPRIPVLVLLLLAVAGVEATAIQARPDSVPMAPSAEFATPQNVQGVNAPAIEERLVTLGVLLVILVGFGVLVNEKRRRADRELR